MAEPYRGNRLFLAGCLVFLTLVGLGTVALPAAAAAPRVSVKESMYDFGEVPWARQLTHNFIIRNEGGEPLRIDYVDPDCACTAVDYPRVIAPGGQGTLTLTIKSYAVIESFVKKTKVWFNDPEHPLIVFTLKGVAQPFIEIKPSHVVRLRGAPGEDLQEHVWFICHLPPPWKITRWRTNIPDKIEVSLNLEVPDKVYMLTIKNKWQEAGTYGGLIELFTTAAQRPRLIVRVFGRLYLPSEATRKISEKRMPRKSIKPNDFLRDSGN
jgi:hypothetical protein